MAFIGRVDEASWPSLESQLSWKMAQCAISVCVPDCSQLSKPPVRERGSNDVLGRRCEESE